MLRSSISEDIKRAMRAAKIALKWSIFSIAIIFALVLWGMSVMIRNSGINVNILFVVNSIFTLFSFLFVPFVWVKIPKNRIKFILSGVFGAFLTALISHALFMIEFEKTPNGILWLEQQKELERKEKEKELERKEKKLEKIRKQEADELVAKFEKSSSGYRDTIESCINWRGQVPSLVRVVRENLHNPKSFEHVETTFTGNSSNPVFRMVYRAENGYGALRTDEVRAIISYDCSVLSLQD